MENEAKERIENIDGKYIDVRPGFRIGLNPMDLEVEEDKNGRRFIDIYGKSTEMTLFLNVLVNQYFARNLDGLEITTIEESLFNLYKHERGGINENPDSLYIDEVDPENNKVTVGKVKKEMPILSDLKVELYKHSYTQDIAKLMEIVTGDGSLAMFDCETTLDIRTQKCVGFGFKDIKDNFAQEFCVLNLMLYTWTRYSDYRYKHINKWDFIDEGWFALKKPAVAELIENMERRGRKYKVSIMFGTQYIGDAIPKEGDDAGTSVILSTSATIFILKQFSKESKKIVKYYDLPEEYASIIPQFSEGEGLLITGTKKTRVQFEMI